MDLLTSKQTYTHQKRPTKKTNKRVLHNSPETSKDTLQHTATHCNTLQQRVLHNSPETSNCNTLQHTATHCNTESYTTVQGHQKRPVKQTLRHQKRPIDINRHFVFSICCCCDRQAACMVQHCNALQ